MKLTKEEIDGYLTSYMFKQKTTNTSKIDKHKSTKVDTITIEDILVKRYINEYWTSKQRQANAIHEIPYRACFKAELPRFFISLLSSKKDVVYDPFAGSGTTLKIAKKLGRNYIGSEIVKEFCDIIEKRLQQL